MLKPLKKKPKISLPSWGLAALVVGGALTASSSAAVVWQDAESVASSSELALAFNNTKIAVRDENGKLHLVWKDANKLRYGHKVEDGTWMIQSFSSAGSGTVLKPSITLVGDDTLLIAWSEQVGASQQRVKFTTSDDLGANWSTPSWVSSSGVDARSVSLAASEGTAGDEPFAAISWHNSNDSTVGVSTWKKNSGWTTPQNPVDPSGVAKDAAIAAQDQTLILTWEDDRTAQKQIRYTVSSDSGANWGSDTLLGVSWVGALNSQGGDPSAAFGPDGQILLGYQHHQSVFLVESDDDGNSFSELREMGDGLFLHLDIAPNGSAFSAWEEFQGDLHDDSIKRFGSAFSTDVFATSDGPFFVPDSDLNYNVAYPAGIVNDDWLDIFWIDQTEEIPVLRHRAAELAIPDYCTFGGDTSCNTDDLDALYAVFNTHVPPTDSLFDLNADNVIGETDLDQWLSLAASENGYSSPYLRGDTDLDHDVDTADLTRMIVNFTGASGSGETWSTGDTDGDGDTDTVDLTTAIINFTSARNTAAAVPEPSGLLLLALAVGCLAAARGRSCRR